MGRAVLKFSGESGRAPQAEARRYVYAVLVSVLENEFNDDEGWMFGGIETEPDRRRLTKAVHAVQKELGRKANR